LPSVSKSRMYFSASIGGVQLLLRYFGDRGHLFNHINESPAAVRKPMVVRADERFAALNHFESSMKKAGKDHWT
jgi:hypothetical protein